jgi:capsule polysaccharide export protein KpsC/LpsZ
MVIATNLKIARIPHLAAFLADYPNVVAGWGRKPSGRRAMLWAKWLKRGYVLLEDGFIRSLHRHDPPLSLLIDRNGTYYDATTACDMESAIAAGISGDQAIRARALIAQWQNAAISKYNHSPNYSGQLPDRYVLVVDQTAGDLSLRLGMADTASFARMLQAAIAENPDCAVVVKVHPDVFSHKKRGNFAPAQLSHPNIILIGDDCHAASLLRGAKTVYTVTSLMGFEALIWGKPTRCFAMPFYAGWGLTIDDMPPPTRRNAASLESLLFAALVTIPRYINPANGTVWQAEDAIAHIGQARQKLGL